MPNAPDPTLTARQLLARIRRAGGRVYRMREHAVFCLTDDNELAQKLIKLGAKPFVSAAQDRGLDLGQWRSAPGAKVQWDLYIHIIPVLGEETIWHAAARDTEVTVEQAAQGSTEMVA